MIVCNIIITCPWMRYENKEQMKQWMTNKYVPDGGKDIDKFREYNFEIAKKYGEEYFSMTFIKPNTVVLTQRYGTWDEYDSMLDLREQTLTMLKQEGFIIRISEPMEQHV